MLNILNLFHSFTCVRAHLMDPETKSRAKYAFGMGYLAGDIVKGRVKIAECIKWVKEAADEGYAPAQFVFGTLAKNWSRTKINSSKVLDFWAKAANQGHKLAKSRLACHGPDLGYLEMVALEGDPAAQFELASRVQFPNQRRDWILASANSGFLPAIEICRQENLNLNLNSEQAVCPIRYHTKQMELGCDESAMILGVYYAKSDKTKERALAPLSVASGYGHAHALFQVWKLGIHFKFDPVRVSLSSALASLAAACELGHAKANSAMGKLFETGQYKDKDHAKAMELYKLAADKGNVHAKFRFAQLTQKTESCSFKEVLPLFDDASRRGCVHAKHRIGQFMSSEGRHEEAAHVFRACAEKKHSPSIIALAQMYGRGQFAAPRENEHKWLESLLGDALNVKGPDHDIHFGIWLLYSRQGMLGRESADVWFRKIENVPRLRQRISRLVKECRCNFPSIPGGAQCCC